MAEKTYKVTGMTCGHCVHAVSTEVGAVPGVSGVDVQLDGGQLTVTGDEFNDEQIRAAVEEAGYALAQ